MKNTGKISAIKLAPLYSLMGKVKNDKLNVRVFPLTKAMRKGKDWSYPSKSGAKKISNDRIGIVDILNLSGENIVFLGYCLKSGINSLNKLIEVTFASSKEKNYKINKLVKPAKSSTVTPEKEVKPVLKEVLTKPEEVLTVTEVEQIIEEVATKENSVATKVFSKIDQEDINAVNEILSGKKEKFSVLYKRYYAIINYKYTSSLKFDKDLADDLTAELFVRVFEKLHQYKPTFTFNSWISRIASNFLIDYTRKKRLETISLSAGVSSEKMRNEGDEYSSFDVKDDGTLNPEEILITEQKKSLINKAVNKLGENCRIIMNKRFVEEKSYNEIAEELNIPLGTIKATIHRGKSELKSIIKANRNVFESVLS